MNGTAALYLLYVQIDSINSKRRLIIIIKTRILVIGREVSIFNNSYSCINSVVEKVVSDLR